MPMFLITITCPMEVNKAGSCQVYLCGCNRMYIQVLWHQPC